MGGDAIAQGYFSLLRWRSDATRDEARNVALLVVVPQAGTAVVRSAPLHRISQRLREQGIVDELLAGLEERFSSAARPGLDLLLELHETFQRSLVVTEPRPMAISDLDADVAALYRAYLAQRGGGPHVQTKGVIRDRVAVALRDWGYPAVRGQYVDDHLFDIVIQNGRPQPTVIEVLSFAGDRKDWTPIEHDAGHFLYSCSQVDVDARVIFRPPNGNPGGRAAYQRVSRWLKQEAIRSATDEQFLAGPQRVTPCG